MDPDFIICFLIVFYAYSGWRKGFIKSILGPVSFIICAVIAWMYFKKTHNVLISFSISFLGPFIINKFVSWIIDVERDPKEPQSFVGLTNRWLGSAVALVWGMSMVFLIILFLMISPLKVATLQPVRASILNSFFFAVISPRLAVFFPAIMPVAPTSESIDNTLPAKRDKGQSAANHSLAQTQEYQNVINDPRVKDLFADPEVAQLIKDKDYFKLLNNPKFAKILEDPQLIAKMLQLQSKIKKN